MITNENFGCGSSREHAVWALKDFGFNVIISPSFADIFYSNCFKNGVLPIILDIKNIKKLLEIKDEVELDLNSQKIIFGDEFINFEIESHRKIRLLEGLDDIDLTLKEDQKIENFEIYKEQLKQRLDPSVTILQGINNQIKKKHI